MFNATVIRRLNITPELAIFYLLPDKGVSEFSPGQYVAVGLYGSAPRPDHFPPDKEVLDPAKLILRAYSIGSPPLEKKWLEFYIAIVPDGALTSRLALVKEGDRIFVNHKITGTFTLAGVPTDKNLVLISTGTGIAPYLSMVRTPATWSAGRKITIVHGVRYSKDFAYSQELQQLAESNKNFSYFPIVSREDPGWLGERGRVQSLFESNKIKLVPDTDHVFLCGNPAMIDDMEKYLVGQGYREHSKRHPGNLHLERYW